MIAGRCEPGAIDAEGRQVDSLEFHLVEKAVGASSREAFTGRSHMRSPNPDAEQALSDSDRVLLRKSVRDLLSVRWPAEKAVEQSADEAHARRPVETPPPDGAAGGVHADVPGLAPRDQGDHLEGDRSQHDEQRSAADARGHLAPFPDQQGGQAERGERGQGRRQRGPTASRQRDSPTRRTRDDLWPTPRLSRMSARQAEGTCGPPGNPGRRAL